MSNYYIPQPCHEKWDQMTPKEKGRHCDVCAKVVVDFTRNTSEEINQIMDQAEGKVCGHFSVTQLHHEAQMKVFKKPSNLLNRNWKYFALASFGVFAFSKKTEAQGRVRLAGKPAPVTTPYDVSTITKIYGTVYSPENKPLAGASVVIYSNSEIIGTTMTIANGSYVFTIQPGKIKDRKISIEADYGGYSPKYISELPIDKSSTRINLTLEEDFMIMGDIAPVEIEEPLMVPDTIKTIPVNSTPVPAEPEKDKTTIEKTETDNIPVQNEKQHKEDDVDHSSDMGITEEMLAVIYPNPAGTLTTIRFEKPDSYTLEVFDVKGSLQQTRYFSGERTSLDVSGLSRGTYFVKVKNDTGLVQTLKLVRE